MVIPAKTFFKTTYAKYTNFGIQKFRIDYNGRTRISIKRRNNIYI